MKLLRPDDTSVLKQTAAARLRCSSAPHNNTPTKIPPSYSGIILGIELVFRKKNYKGFG